MLGLGLRSQNVVLGLEGCGLGRILQSLALLLAVKEYEALKPLFRRLLFTPVT